MIFLPYTYFFVTHGIIMLGRQGGKCVFRLMSVKDVFEILRFLK